MDWANQSPACRFSADVQFGNVANAVPFKHRHDLQRHFVRHGEEFGSASADEYERRADAFMIGPLRDGAMECRRGGDLLRFDPRTAEFGVLAVGGNIRTFMIVRPLPSARQTALEYFQSKCK
jgi:pyocin large subunit-like protein